MSSSNQTATERVASPGITVQIRELETERLVLEPLSPKHVPQIAELISDWEVIKFLASRVPWPYSPEDALTFIDYITKASRSGDGFGWALTEKINPGQAIGCISLERNGDAWVRGFWLGRPFQKRGYMTEAVIRVTDFAFKEAGIARLEIPTFIGNEASSRIKTKTAGHVIRREPIPSPRPGVPYTEQEVWEITVDEWNNWRSAVPTPVSPH